MGMDVYGKNPIENKKKSDFPMLVKVDKLEKKEEWKERRELIDTQSDNYWKERNEYENANKGMYFRNNCWWWRPLWDFCYNVAPELISDELWSSGHHNDGAGLDAKDAKLIGNRLLQQIREGKTIEYQASYQQYLDDLPDNDCMRCNNNNHGNNKKKDCTNCNKTGKSENFNKHYPFDIDNVKEFAEFCMESGGFKIC